MNNFAFIDGQNLNLGVKKLDWKLDFKKFRIYLKEKYKISQAFLFIGFIPKNQDLYCSLQNNGDFYCLIEYLYKENKLLKVMSPDRRNCSKLLKKAAKEKIVFMDNLCGKLKYKPKRKNTA